MCCWCFVVCWTVKDDPGQTKSKNWTDVSLQRKWWSSSPQSLGGKVVVDFCKKKVEVKWKRFRMTNNNLYFEHMFIIRGLSFLRIRTANGAVLWQVREAWGWAEALDWSCLVHSARRCGEWGLLVNVTAPCCSKERHWCTASLKFGPANLIFTWHKHMTSEPRESFRWLHSLQCGCVLTR